MESDKKVTLACEIVAITHKNNIDVVKTVDIDHQIQSNSTFKNPDCVVGSVFTLSCNNEITSSQ